MAGVDQVLHHSGPNPSRGASNEYMHVLNLRYWKWEKSGSPQSQRQFDIFGERCGQVAATGGPHARQVVGTVVGVVGYDERSRRSDEHTSELQSLMRL